MSEASSSIHKDTKYYNYNDALVSAKMYNGIIKTFILLIILLKQACIRVFCSTCSTYDLCSCVCMTLTERGRRAEAQLSLLLARVLWWAPLLPSGVCVRCCHVRHGLRFPLAWRDPRSCDRQRHLPTAGRSVRANSSAPSCTTNTSSFYCWSSSLVFFFLLGFGLLNPSGLLLFSIHPDLNVPKILSLLRGVLCDCLPHLTSVHRHEFTQYLADTCITQRQRLFHAVVGGAANISIAQLHLEVQLPPTPCPLAQVTKTLFNALWKITRYLLYISRIGVVTS